MPHMKITLRLERKITEIATVELTVDDFIDYDTLEKWAVNGANSERLWQPDKLFIRSDVMSRSYPETEDTELCEFCRKDPAIKFWNAPERCYHLCHYCYNGAQVLPADVPLAEVESIPIGRCDSGCTPDCEYCHGINPATGIQWAAELEEKVNAR